MHVFIVCVLIIVFFMFIPLLILFWTSDPIPNSTFNPSPIPNPDANLNSNPNPDTNLNSNPNPDTNLNPSPSPTILTDTGSNMNGSNMNMYMYILILVLVLLLGGGLFMISKRRRLRRNSLESKGIEFSTPVEEKFVACLILSAVGDAMGYKNGKWEFNYSGEEIHKELKQLTGKEGMEGISALRVDTNFSIVSDDTIMAIATVRALLRAKEFPALGEALAEEYIKCWDRMDGRAPGTGTAKSIEFLKTNDKGKAWNHVPFNPKSGGCGAAMRAHPIGLLYHRKRDLHRLVEISIESGRITHHSPAGYLGAVASALFVALAFRKQPAESWGFILMNEAIPYAKEYIRKENRYVKENLVHFHVFEEKWNMYLKSRNLSNGTGPVQFPKEYENVAFRDEMYNSWAFQGTKPWGGSSGFDAPMIAYDAFLGAHHLCSGDMYPRNGCIWEQLCLLAMLHGGDSDSTGTIAGAIYGAMYGFNGVPKINYEYVELKNEIVGLAKKLAKKL
jgi:ADP-ribosylarginine hydrolase